MAANLPAKLKAAGVQRFATRAVQLEKFRPIVTYWCEYYILQHILQKQLHTTDEECTAYAVELMDKLEKYKAESSGNDAIVDDLAAKAYIENFALETLNRGYGTQAANKVTLQTADTFSAAATFLELLSIWGPLDTDIGAKVKFAKFHAARIAKAIKAGEDPNASNPVVEPANTPSAIAADASLEAELREMERSEDATQSRQPTVEAVPEDENEHTASAPVTGHAESVSARATDHGQLLDNESETRNDRAGSIGGGYFPEVPSTVSSAPALRDTSPYADFYHSSHAPHPSEDQNQPAAQDVSTSQPASSVPTQHTSAPSIVQPPPIPIPAVPSLRSTNSSSGPYREDDESIAAAQKHAKWAISALNFEDVSTAVKELRIALQSLGAT